MARITAKELMKECRSAPAKASTDKPAGLVWLHGKAAPAPDGAVALRLADGSTALILAKDIIEADRGDEGQFGVATAIDTNVIIVRAYVRRAFEISAGKENGCGCSDVTTMARAFGGGGLGSCMAHCNALESFCMGSGPNIHFFSASVSVGDLEDALIHGAHCRDIWIGCATRCFDQTFSRS